MEISIIFFVNVVILVRAKTAEWDLCSNFKPYIHEISSRKCTLNIHIKGYLQLLLSIIYHLSFFAIFYKSIFYNWKITLSMLEVTLSENSPGIICFVTSIFFFLSDRKIWCSFSLLTKCWNSSNSLVPVLFSLQSNWCTVYCICYNNRQVMNTTK